MRYGHQPLSEVMALPVRKLLGYADALAELVQRENALGRVETG